MGPFRLPRARGRASEVGSGDIFGSRGEAEPATPGSYGLPPRGFRSLEAAAESLGRAGFAADLLRDELRTRDPWGTRVRLRAAAPPSP